MTPWLFLAVLAFLGGGRASSAEVPFERVAGPEMAGFRQRVTGIRGAKPSVQIEKRGDRAAVVAALGEKRTGGYEIEIHKIELRGKTLLVTARITEPARDAFVTQALTYPADAVWVDAKRLKPAENALRLILVDEKGKVLAKRGPGAAK